MKRMDLSKLSVEELKVLIGDALNTVETKEIEKLEENKRKYPNHPIFKSGDKRNIPIVMLDKDTNELLYVFSSEVEAIKLLNETSKGYIGKACKGERSSAFGFKWMYLYDYNNR